MSFCEISQKLNFVLVVPFVVGFLFGGCVFFFFQVLALENMQQALKSTI